MRESVVGEQTSVVRQNSVGVYLRDIRAKLRFAYEDRVELMSARADDVSVTERSCVRCVHAAVTSTLARRTGWRSRGLPFVAVMQAADFRNDDDRPWMLARLVGDLARPRWVRLR